MKKLIRSVQDRIEIFFIKRRIKKCLSATVQFNLDETDPSAIIYVIGCKQDVPYTRSDSFMLEKAMRSDPLTRVFYHHPTLGIVEFVPEKH